MSSPPAWRPCSGTRGWAGAGTTSVVAEHRVRVHDGADVGPRGEDVAVERHSLDGGAPRRRARGRPSVSCDDRRRRRASSYGMPRRRDRSPSAAAHAMTLPDMPAYSRARSSAAPVSTTARRARACRRHAPLLREQRAPGRRATRRDAALGDEAGDQPRGRDVEGGVGDAAAVRRDAHARAAPDAAAPATVVTSSAARSSIGMPSARRRRSSSRSRATAPRRRTARRCRCAASAFR